MRPLSVWTTAGFLIAATVLAQPMTNGVNQPSGSPNRDPDKVSLVTSDIANFWRAYDHATPQNKREVFDREYFQKGSIGLKDFFTVRIKSIESLVGVMDIRPRYYASIRQSTLSVDSMQGAIRNSLRKLKEIYAEAVFPDVYFLIGKMSSGGTTSMHGLLIGTEMYGRTAETPMAELNDWLKQVIRPIDDLPAIVAHELIHIQQKSSGSPDNLLAQSVNEGAADFLGEMIAGKMINAHLHEYGNPREKELWEKFKQDMPVQHFANWLYNAGQTKDRPADLGYYIGYKIVECYYNRISDKKQAVKDILEVSNFEEFLRSSGYEQKPKK